MPLVIGELLDWARSQELPATLVGGVAVCLHGAVRSTDDIDLLVLTSAPPAEVLRSLRARGFEPRYADPVAFAEAARVLLVRHTDSGVDVDVMLGMLPFEHEVVERSSRKRGPFGTIPFASSEALCVMKLIAGRPQDLRDVALLLDAYPELDRGWVLEHLRQYALMMESPEVLERARTMLG